MPPKPTVGDVCCARHRNPGTSDDAATPGFTGTVTLYIDNAPVGKSDIVAQPGAFCRAPKNMVRTPAGRFAMGGTDFYPGESPVLKAEIGEFWMDEYPVTNAEFRRFVRVTGHVTVAERTPDAARLPGRRPRSAGSP